MRRKVAIVASTRMSTVSITSLSEEQGDDPAPLRLVQPAADVRKGFPPVRRGDSQVAAERPLEPFRLPASSWSHCCATLPWYRRGIHSPATCNENNHPSS